MFIDEFNSSWLTSSNSSYLENLYEQFLLDPSSINTSWSSVFSNSFKKTCKYSEFQSLHGNSKNNKNYVELAIQLINIFRTLGYQHAHLDPLNLSEHVNILTLKEFLNDINNFDVNKLFSITLSKCLFNNITLKNLYSILKNIYCKNIGYQYTHICDFKEKKWIQNYIETKNKNFLTKTEQTKILKYLVSSETLEKYFSSKFPGIKRFSIEGAESLIPMLKEATNYTQKFNLRRVIFGMSHRGRLNVLFNILSKPIKIIFNEFSENNLDTSHSGDVKYHMGFRYTKKVGSRQIVLDLKSNPSHLEIINPVILGASRAYIDSNDHVNVENILPIIIHGDAAISGQGVVQELLNMSQVRGYQVGGTIHIVVNNQIGFTTSNSKDLRTSKYCTDIAKMIDSPIFHVNSDDPESAVFVMRLALDYRFYFKKDVFINLVCYRRHGHNEVDDPKITQPLMYSKIKNHPTIVDIYHNKLLLNNIIHENYLNIYTKTLKQELSAAYNSYKRTFCSENYEINSNFESNVTLTPRESFVKNVSLSNLKSLAKNIFYIPSYIKVHDRVLKIYQNRLDMANGDRLFDWGASELLAYASLLNCGMSCRLSGEDVCRGTFSHRHAVIYDQNNNLQYIPLQNINSCQGKFYIWDSVLSEEAALAFEYGYSIDQKNTLNVWEAQFGDFANGAQIVIDQFICSGEQKWGTKCNLVMFLPHGYEGQGPEHSSARIERYLQLSADNNIRIQIPTTASQIYHIIRQQALCLKKKPLIVITPKSLLRFPLASSSLSELSNNKFEEVIDEIDEIKSKKLKRIILCSGKIYYELLIQRRFNKQDNIAILRIEQLYPFPSEKLLNLLCSYDHVNDFIWCQEEPYNQGAWLHNQFYLKKILSSKSTLGYIGRPASASPATGYIKVHKEQQKKIIHDALTI